MKSEKPIECVGCNTFDVGSIMDNSECDAKVERLYATEQEARQALAHFTQVARNVESEPCQIASDINVAEGGYLLNAVFTFGCQAEAVIFQLKTR